MAGDLSVIVNPYLWKWPKKEQEASTKTDLQYSVYNLKTVNDMYNMKINTDNKKIITFCGKYPIPSKICLKINFSRGKWIFTNKKKKREAQPLILCLLKILKP